jgi:transmembrane sensor
MTMIGRNTCFAVLLLLLAASWQCKDRREGSASGTGAIYLSGSVYQNTTEEWKRVRLPDSTEVMMNARTIISISTSFGKAARELKLDGEAVFKVKGDPANPFVVHTRNLDISVLGTRFRVNAHADSPGEEVDLLSGSLKVRKSYHSSTDSEPETLQAGELIMINRDIDLMEKERLDSTEWKKLQELP